MPKLETVKVHLCPTCGKMMEKQGDVHVCRGCNVSHWGPYLERKNGKK